jgi:beta-lactamase superfamily II metal-dependent hydrolase
MIPKRGEIMANSKTAFCAYPSAFIYATPAAKAGKNIKKHLIWGDTILLNGKESGSFLGAYSRGENGWMKKTDIQKDPLLDIIFLDVGQGDSCLIVTPEDQRIIIDTGQEDNLVRYLRWRYNYFDNERMKKMGGKIKAIVVSHPDADHYNGLQSLFKEKKYGVPLNVETIYHNGIFALSGSGVNSLGDIKKIGSESFITNPILNGKELDAFYKKNKSKKLDKFCKIIFDIKKDHKDIEFQMLNSLSDGSEIVKSGVSFKVLGPLVEKSQDGHPMLRTFGSNKGIAKNGNSVVLMLTYQNIRILFSGDLNSAAGSYLYEFYEGSPDSLKAEVLKVSHHGSSDFYDKLIAKVNPRASVISSGDNESYSHPRADTVGFLGKIGCGDRPLVFSTEIGRSMIPAKVDKKALAKLSEEDRKKQEKAHNKMLVVYGAINLRTDGTKILLSQQKEKKNSQHQEWDIYRLEPKKGVDDLVLVTKGPKKSN